MLSERKQILDLLAEGKISSDEAQQLLDRIEAGNASAVPTGAGNGSGALPKFMCVRVETHQGDVVNVRVPLALVKSGIKLSAMMPKNAADAMSKNGIDLSQLGALSGDQLIEALRAMEVDVTSHEGDCVKVTCE
jgi:hypothetical protein